MHVTVEPDCEQLDGNAARATPDNGPTANSSSKADPTATLTRRQEHGSPDSPPTTERPAVAIIADNPFAPMRQASNQLPPYT